nr:Protein ATG-11 [Haemonchus contortus]
MRTRLDSWIVRVYNRLHHAHNELLMFEEKCTGLKQRLDLLEQVKEAPVMYATAVTEIVRRRTFQREFNSWFSVHVNKCCSLYDEETRIRAEFSTKMEKHFLRVLFHGMFDTIPPFFVKSLPEFDTALSPINDQYLKELRNQNIEELNQYLNVAPPQVFLRLDVRRDLLSEQFVWPSTRRVKLGIIMVLIDRQEPDYWTAFESSRKIMINLVLCNLLPYGGIFQF